MVFEYYVDSDMLYIKLAEGRSTESEEIAPGVVLNFDERNRVIGIEIEDASESSWITEHGLGTPKLTTRAYNADGAGL